MSTVIDVYLRTTHPLPAVEQAFRTQLQARGVDPVAYWIRFEPADAEARERGHDEFGFEPTLRLSMQPPRGHGDAELEIALLATAQTLDGDWVAVRTDTPILAYHAGTAFIPDHDRAYYEQQVLPHFSGAVRWTAELPWRAR